MVETPDIKKAKEILDAGGVIGFPTETVYGLAARIDIPSAIEKIFTTKERPFFDPLIVHVFSIAQAKSLVSAWTEAAEVLAQTFWPGPLTLVLPKKQSLNPMITSGLETVGLRMPAHPVALEILKAVGTPLAAPSANKFGRTSPTSAAHVRGEFAQENVFVLEGGESQIGIESTVLAVQFQGAKTVLSVLRKGHVLRSDIDKVLSAHGLDFEFVETTDRKASPGHMKHHYMPAIPLLLSLSPRSETELLVEANRKLQALPAEIEGVKIIKPTQGLAKPAKLELSADPVLATRELYARLREAAQSGADCIIYYQSEEQKNNERWEALMDRLHKAASLIL